MLREWQGSARNANINACVPLMPINLIMLDPSSSAFQYAAYIRDMSNEPAISIPWHLMCMNMLLLYTRTTIITARKKIINKSKSHHVKIFVGNVVVAFSINVVSLRCYRLLVTHPIALFNGCYMRANQTPFINQKHKKMPFDSGKWKCLCFVSAYGNGNKIATWNLRACWSTIQWTSVNKLMWKLVLWEKLNSFSYSGWGHAAHWENIVQARERKLWTDWKCILDCITKHPQGKMVCRIASN